METRDIIVNEIIKAIAPKLSDGLGKIYTTCATTVKAWNESKSPRNEKLILKLSSEDQFFRRLETIITESYNWSKEINFKDLQSKKSLLNHFVHIDFFLTPISTHFDTQCESKKSVSQLIQDCENHLIILGGPGAGKTTVTKFITLEGFQKKSMFNDFSYTLPLLIRLREFNSLNTLDDFFWTLLNFLGIDLNVEQPKRLDREEVSKGISDAEKATLLPTAKQLAVEIIDSLNVIFILDGLDELSSTKFVKSTVESVRKLCLSLQNSKVVLTSRTGEYYSSIDNATTVEIAPLSVNQISEFVEKWMNNSEKSIEFLSQLNRSPFRDTAIRPINLAHLCALYIRYQEIPKQPRTIYEKIVMLLIEEWDLQRDIKRVSNFDLFTSIRKKEFLSTLSYELTKKYKTSIFSKAQLNSIYIEISRNFDLGRDEGFLVISEIESHTGLFVQSGYDKYEFSHKSLQEYLTADYLIRNARLMSISEKVMHMPNEYAIAISLSSNPSSTLYDLLLFKSNTVLPDLKAFLRKFVLRIIVEKPDFNSSPYTAAAVAKIGTLLQYSLETSEDIYRLLHCHPNIEKSFRGLKHYWQLREPTSTDNLGLGIYSFKQFVPFDDEHIFADDVINMNAEMYKLYLQTSVMR